MMIVTRTISMIPLSLVLKLEFVITQPVNNMIMPSITMEKPSGNDGFDVNKLRYSPVRVSRIPVILNGE